MTSRRPVHLAGLVRGSDVLVYCDPPGRWTAQAASPQTVFRDVYLTRCERFYTLTRSFATCPECVAKRAH